MSNEDCYTSAARLLPNQIYAAKVHLKPITFSHIPAADLHKNFWLGSTGSTRTTGTIRTIGIARVKIFCVGQQLECV
jgi:hypothetical protein